MILTTSPGRRASRAAVVALTTAALLLAACGGDDESDAAPPEPDAEQEQATNPVEADGDLPPPDTFEGRVRAINLYVDAEGETLTVDLWAARSFTHGPALLAEGIGPGEASDYVEAPAGQSLILVPSGEGPDGEDLGSVFGPGPEEQITGVLTWESADSPGFTADGPVVASFWERSPERPDVEPPPGDDEALLIIRAGQLSAHEDELEDTYGGRSFNVGDGSGACLPQQRVEAEGFSPATLGGTNPTVHEVSPGTLEVTFHAWPTDSDCEEDPMFGPIQVDLAAGETVLLVLWTPDGSTIEALTFPVE